MNPLIVVLVALLCVCLIESKPYFYIYDWPKEFDDLWPQPGAQLHNRSGYNHEFYENFGAGKCLNSTFGLFQTWQFSLYKNVMARLKVSEHRTRDPKEASAFIIPFDLGVHSYIDHKDGHPRLASPFGWAAGYFLINAFRDKKLYWHNNGHDHFILFSITAYQMVGIGVKVFFMQICQNCTTITIETSPTRTAIKGRTRKHWYAAPYPSSFHWHEDIKELPWLSPPDDRHLLALFIGSVRTSQPNSNNLRKLLYDQCTVDKECQWHKTAHACNGVVNAGNVMSLLRLSRYCPAPTGDSITRKSIFDSLVAGCVPVLFSKASLEQYIWHLSKEDVERVSVYIPMSDINEKGVNFLSILRSIPASVLAEKQEYIRKLAPTLQYSIVPQRIGNTAQVWAPPFRDAVDVIIEKIIDPKTIAPIQGFTDAELLAQVNLQNDIMDNHEDYAALRGPKNNVKMKDKKQIAENEKGISKLVTEPLYPPKGSLMLSSEFIPDWVFLNTDIVEFNGATGKISYVTDSPSYAKQRQQLSEEQQRLNTEVAKASNTITNVVSVSVKKEKRWSL